MSRAWSWAFLVISALGLIIALAGDAALWITVLNALCFGYWTGNIVGES